VGSKAYRENTAAIFPAGLGWDTVFRFWRSPFFQAPRSAGSHDSLPCASLINFISGLLLVGVGIYNITINWELIMAFFG
jgi:hypothetical protein